MSGPLHAILCAEDRPGRYPLHIPSVSFTLTHTYVVNRSAKVLDLAGIQGVLAVNDCDTGELRMRVGIAKAARCMFSETDTGIRHLPWSDHSLRSLKKHVAAVKQSVADGRKGIPGTNYTGIEQTALPADAIR